jgi:hypothetical protein
MGRREAIGLVEGIHLLAALAGYWVLSMLQERRPVRGT